MPFKHPCFISYVRGDYGLVKVFMDQLVNGLNDYLEPYFKEPLYLDTKELKGGERFERKLAEAICRSVCMIVVYSPKYDTRNFCLREYRAMEILEERRLHLLGDRAQGRGLIIPIVLRGNLPDKIKQNIQYHDFSSFTTATRDIRKNSKYVEVIDGIAAYIYNLKVDLEELAIDVCGNCKSFTLPPADSVSPLGSGNSTPPFPGS
jgi:hypothetical protein